MNQLPNILTISRLFLTVLFIFCILQTDYRAILLAIVFFTLASISDYYDGFLAKKHDLISNFGTIMDPIADKFLMLSAFFIFMSMGVIPLWMFMIIAVREVTLTSLRIYAITKGSFLAAEKTGKIKTVAQMVSVFVILIYILLSHVAAGVFDGGLIYDIWHNSIYVIMLFTVVITLFSGMSYLWHNRKVFLT